MNINRTIKNSMIKILLATALTTIIMMVVNFEREYLFVISLGAYIVCEMCRIEHLYDKIERRYEYEKYQNKSKKDYIKTLRQTVYALNCEKLDDEKEIKELKEILSKNMIVESK